MDNPFLEKKYNTPFETVPFDKIRFEHYEEAMREGMKRDDEDIDRLVNNPEPASFDNTIIPKGDRTLSKVSNVFFNLLSADTNDQMDELAQKMSPILTEHSNKIMFNEGLWQRVQAVYKDHRELTAEESMLLDNMYQSFVRHGALLSAEDKKRFAQLQMELSQNMLRDTNVFQLHLESESQLSGLPDSQIEAAALAAKEKGLQGWLFTLHAPSYGPFMTYADDAELRKRMYMAHATLCTQGEYNNLPLIPRIVNTRRQLVNLLGYSTFVDFVLERRMASDVAHVRKLLDDLLQAYLPTARKEIEEVAELARETQGPDYILQPWDLPYYSHKLKIRRYDIDSEMLRPYFELSRVKKGVFGLATRLYGITFHPNKDIPVYHPDVEAWEVHDADDSLLGILYTDFHPRASKQSGAWMTAFKEQWTDEEDGDSRPHVSVTMNFTKPTETKPALLTLGEVETFLHEFGHSLHALFSKVRFESLSCTNVYWDFVELPSQFMENYVTEPEFLNTFAFHYETGEPIPEELIKRIQLSRNFMVAYACVRQVSFGLLDLAYYTLKEDLDSDIYEFERKAVAPCRLLSSVPEEYIMSTNFSHIMSGGYAAGYYSYKWAEVLDADAFDEFRKHGIFDRTTAQRFRDEILSRGGTEPPMQLYRRFRGAEPTIDALLKRNGIKNG